MNTILENNLLSVTISSTGAEVLEIRRLDIDCSYLWNGDPLYWTGHSPVLFPIICAAMNGAIKVDGKAYPIGNHGFARKSEFELIEIEGCKAVYQLGYSEKTLKMYPFKFQLTITFTIVENRLEIDYRVDNVDEKKIFFQIGTHPGFNCPLEPQGAFEDYYLEFEHAENLDRQFLNAANVRVAGKVKSLGTAVHKLKLTHELFAEGALVFKHFQSKKVTLKSDQSDRSVVVSFENMHQMGIWQSKNAPFICIESWHGLADEDGFTGEFKNRESIIHLPQGQSFSSHLVIEAN